MGEIGFLLSVLEWGATWGLLGGLLCVIRLRVAPRVVGHVAVACALHALASLPGRWWGLLLGSDSPVPISALVVTVPRPDWLSKVLGVLVSWLLVYGLRWTTPAAAGLRRPTWPTGRALGLAVGTAALWQLTDAILSRHYFLAQYWESRLFTVLMPGLSEELFYRGVLLGLLSGVFPRTIPWFGTRTSWGGLVGLLLFGLAHVAGPPFQGSYYPVLGADLPARLLQTLVLGGLLLWVRERTDSVWPAVATHCLLNACLVLGHALP